MTDPINTQNRLRNPGVSADTRAGSAPKANSQAPNGNASAGSSGENSTVELSSAAIVESLSEQIRNLPEVNQARVDAIKQALGNGDYKADADVIARKFNEIEKLLP